MTDDPRIAALPDSHGHVKGEHKPFAEERPIPYTARMLFLWFYHACRRGAPRFMMVADHVNYLTFEDPASVNLVRRALKLASAGDLYGAAETAGVDLNHAALVSEGLRRGMRFSVGAEVDNDPRNRPDAANIVDAMRPDGIVRAVHFLPIAHPVHGENWMWPFDNVEFKELFDVVGTERTWELYIAALVEAIEKLPGHIVGHVYGPAKFGHWPSDAALQRYEDQIVAACAQRGMAVEINSRPFYRYLAGDVDGCEKYRAANLRLLQKAKANGVAVAVGSGAHSPKDQGAGFDTVLTLLDKAGVNEIAFPIDGRLARVALRATEELVRRASGYAETAASETVSAPVQPTAEPRSSDGAAEAGREIGAQTGVPTVERSTRARGVPRKDLVHEPTGTARTRRPQRASDGGAVAGRAAERGAALVASSGERRNTDEVVRTVGRRTLPSTPRKSSGAKPRSPVSPSRKKRSTSKRSHGAKSAGAPKRARKRASSSARPGVGTQHKRQSLSPKPKLRKAKVKRGGVGVSAASAKKRSSKRAPKQLHKQARTTSRKTASKVKKTASVRARTAAQRKSSRTTAGKSRAKKKSGRR